MPKNMQTRTGSEDQATGRCAEHFAEWVVEQPIRHRSRRGR